MGQNSKKANEAMCVGDIIKVSKTIWKVATWPPDDETLTKKNREEKEKKIR